jgi:hypothetical protein
MDIHNGDGFTFEKDFAAQMKQVGSSPTER